MCSANTNYYSYVTYVIYSFKMFIHNDSVTTFFSLLFILLKSFTNVNCHSYYFNITYSFKHYNQCKLELTLTIFNDLDGG